MSRHFSRHIRAALLVPAFAALAFGSPCAGGAPPVTSRLNLSPTTYPLTLSSIDKSVMSNYGADAVAAYTAQYNLIASFRGFGIEQFLNPGDASIVLALLKKALVPLDGPALTTVTTRIGNIQNKLDRAAQEDERLVKDFPRQSLSFGVGTLRQGGASTTIFPELTYSNGSLGADLSFEEYSDNLPGYGVSVKYYPGKQREHLSRELAHLFHSRKQLKTESRLFRSSSLKLGRDLNALVNRDSLQTRKALFDDLTTQNDQIIAAATAMKDTLVREIVDYSVGFQTNVYVRGRYFNDQGFFAAQGVSVGQLVPLGTTGLSPSVLAQAVQFYSRNAVVPSGSDGQYGFALVWQSEANGYRKSDDPAIPPLPVIRPWHVKIGYEYYSKVFGGTLATPYSHDLFLRLRFPGRTPVEITPYIGWAGRGHSQYTGLNMGITVPLPF